MKSSFSLLHNRTFKISWQQLFAAAMLCMLVFYLMELLLPMRWVDIYTRYGICAIALLTGVYLARCGFSGPVEVKLLLAYTVWVLLTRWLNGDIYLFVDFDLVLWVLLAFLCFACGTLLDKKSREVFLDILTLIYVGVFFTTAIAGIFVFITDSYIHIPPENVWITILNEGGLNSLNALSSHRLNTVVRFFLAASLLVYQFFKRKNIVVRVLCILAYIPMHLAISLCHGRTAQIAMSLCFAMLMLLVFIPVFEKRSKPLRIAALPVIMLLSLLLFYKSFGVCDLIFDKARQTFVPAFEEYYDSLENKPNTEYFGIRMSAEELAAAIGVETDEEKSEDAPNATPSPEERVISVAAKDTEQSVVDERKLIGNWTFTGRTEIWHSGFIAISENMHMALFGTRTKDLMPLINNILVTRVNPTVTEYKTHMHNSYIQAMMYFGIPGLLLVLAWTVLIVRRMLMVYFSKKTSPAEKFLTIPLAGIFVECLAEVFIFTTIESIGMVFFFLAGILVACHREHFHSGAK